MTDLTPALTAEQWESFGQGSDTPLGGAMVARLHKRAGSVTLSSPHAAITATAPDIHALAALALAALPDGDARKITAADVELVRQACGLARQLPEFDRLAAKLAALLPLEGA